MVLDVTEIIRTFFLDSEYKCYTLVLHTTAFLLFKLTGLTPRNKGKRARIDRGSTTGRFTETRPKYFKHQLRITAVTTAILVLFPLTSAKQHFE